MLAKAQSEQPALWSAFVRVAPYTVLIAAVMAYHISANMPTVTYEQDFERIRQISDLGFLLAGYAVLLTAYLTVRVIYRWIKAIAVRDAELAASRRVQQGK